MSESLEKPALDENTVEGFAARCAHDFNNLLTGILGNLELMQARAARNGVTHFDGYIEGARNAAGRAASFTQRLLIFSGRDTQAPAPVPVDRLVADLAETAAAPGQPIEAALGAGDAMVFCDAAQLEIALAELLTNAREAGAATRRVTTAADAGSVTIRVIDNGPGMSAAILSRATEPFFSTRANGAGKGLGLALAARFARHAGGTLEIASEAGAGTTARLTLPRR